MSLDQQLQPIESLLPRGPVRDQADAYYGRLFGWPLKWRGSQPFLVLENGICAVTMPTLDSGPVLARLASTGCQGPAILLSTPRGPRVAVLAETDGLIPSRAELPRNFDLLAWGSLLPLPVGSRRTGDDTDWISAPDPQRRWLPSLSAVVAGIRPR
ncbi:glycogen operon protein GlgX [Amycolatopsis orientalis]|uniref:Glycogen operon protein GlgX n=1 Tax=Amycolatopsis orientalis TaxID=31958 RepID=A0A193C1E4_AMYOR|nr:hypothetical protein [Amycolatopsis orientalis]ANN18297.1 glycogen operon protein GlgX [Amycolatopsis orientalis]